MADNTRIRVLRNILVAVTLVFTPLLSAPPVHAQNEVTPRYSTTVSYTPLYHAPLVQVWINGNVSCTFLVDTGANNIYLTEKLVKRLGLPSYPAVKEGHPYMLGDKQARAVSVSQIQIGSFSSSNPQVLLAADPSPSFPFSFDGILGTNLLSMFSVLFDFPRHQITLWTPAGLSVDEIKGLGMSAATILPLTEREDGTFTVPGKVWSTKAQADVSLLLDTGAAETALTVGLARQLQLLPASSTTVHNFWGDVDFEEARINALQLVGLKFVDRPVNYASKEDARHPALLGMDILSGYKVLLDFPSKKMYLQPSPSVVTVGPAVKPPTAKTP